MAEIPCQCGRFPERDKARYSSHVEYCRFSLSCNCGTWRIQFVARADTVEKLEKNWADLQAQGLPTNPPQIFTDNSTHAPRFTEGDTFHAMLAFANFLNSPRFLDPNIPRDTHTATKKFTKFAQSI